MTVLNKRFTKFLKMSVFSQAGGMPVPGQHDMKFKYCVLLTGFFFQLVKSSNSVQMTLDQWHLPFTQPIVRSMDQITYGPQEKIASSQPFLTTNVQSRISPER